MNGNSARRGDACFRFASPKLQPTDEQRRRGETGFILYECPIGMLLREAPWVFDLLDRLRHTEAMSPLDAGRMPRYFQHLNRVAASMREWIREQKQMAREISSQAQRMHGGLSG